jgi:translocation and assembly module TamB
LTIERFEIAEAVLSEAVLGAPARFSISGQIQAGDPERAIVASITVQDMERPNFARADAEYRADRGTLKIAASAEEKTGGVLTTLLDLDGAQDLKLELNGDGPLDRWRGDLQLAVNGSRAAGGKLALSEVDGRLSIAMDADGEIGRFAPEPYASLLTGNSQFNLEADYLYAAKVRLRALKLDAPRLKISAAGVADLKRHSLSGKGRIELGQGENAKPIAIKLDEATELSIQNAEIIIDAVPGNSGIELKAELDAKGLAVNGNSLESLIMTASAIQPERGRAFFEELDALKISARAEQPRFADPAYAPLVGDELTLALSGRKTVSELTITSMQVNGAGGSVNLAGVLNEAGFEGTANIVIPDADVLSSLAGRELDGALSLSASGQAAPSGHFDLALEGARRNLMPGDDAMGKLFAGSVNLNGRIVHDGHDIRFDQMSVVSRALNLVAEGSYGTQQSDLRISGNIPDISAILPNSSGAVQVEASLGGEGEQQALNIAINAAKGELHGLPVQGVSIAYEGKGNFRRQMGSFSARGQIGPSALKGDGQINLGQDDGHSIRNFELALGGNRLIADLVLPAGGKAKGQAHLHLTDTSLLSTILGVPIEGAAEIEVQLSGNASSPQIHIKAGAQDFTYDFVQFASLDVDMVTDDAFTRPVYSGHAAIGSVKVDGEAYGPVRIESEPEDSLSAMTIEAGLSNGTQLSARTAIALPDWQPDISLTGLVLKHPRAVIRQNGAARLQSAEHGYTLDGLVLQSGNGQASANAVIGDKLDGRITLTALPLGLAEIFAPNLSPQGTLNGEISLGGTADQPVADYKLVFRDLSEASALPPGFPKIDLSAAGKFANGTLTIDAKASGVEGISFSTSGVIRDLGRTNALELKGKGAVPMRLANSFLAIRGTKIEGNARVDLAVSGRADAPVMTGSLAASDATLNDPSTGISLTNISLGATLDGRKILIEKLTARSANGGAVEASGTLDVSTLEKLPASIKLSVKDLQFNDRRIVAGQASSTIKLEGDLLGQSDLSGKVDISRLDVRIPQALPASVSALELKHKNAPAHIKALQREPEETAKGKSSASIRLALDVNSADRIFVTGRGLDAQLGGQIRLTGSSDKPQAIGQFTLERGRMDLLGRSLDITSGTLDFRGDLDPKLNFTAVADVDSTRITITLTGSASSPQFSFSSQPELPEDEILALLLFNKSLTQLTPSQAVQLASQVSELGGLAGGPGVLDKLKTSLGIDRLDLTTTEDGDVAVSAGSYLNENLYVGVEQGAGNSSQVKVDLDITKNIKIRGEAGADGESKLGVGVEWEY